jgi:hypothetical protein
LFGNQWCDLCVVIRAVCTQGDLGSSFRSVSEIREIQFSSLDCVSQIVRFASLSSQFGCLFSSNLWNWIFVNSKIRSWTSWNLFAFDPINQPGGEPVGNQKVENWEWHSRSRNRLKWFSRYSRDRLTKWGWPNINDFLLFICEIQFWMYSSQLFREFLEHRSVIELAQSRVDWSSKENQYQMFNLIQEYVKVDQQVALSTIGLYSSTKFSRGR